MVWPTRNSSASSGRGSKPGMLGVESALLMSWPTSTWPASTRPTPKWPTPKWPTSSGPTSAGLIFARPHAGPAVLEAADVQMALREVEHVPAQPDQLGDPQAVAVGE